MFAAVFVFIPTGFMPVDTGYEGSLLLLYDRWFALVPGLLTLKALLESPPVVESVDDIDEGIELDWDSPKSDTAGSIVMSMAPNWTSRAPRPRAELGISTAEAGILVEGGGSFLRVGLDCVGALDEGGSCPPCDWSIPICTCLLCWSAIEFMF